MKYPHWLMVAGGLLVLLGFTGLALRKRPAERAYDDVEQEFAPYEDRAPLRSGLTGRPPEYLNQVNRPGFKK
jgi:hypothetical protein